MTMDRQTFYYGQEFRAEELNTVFDNIDKRFKQICTDTGLHGIVRSPNSIDYEKLENTFELEYFTIYSEGMHVFVVSRDKLYRFSESSTATHDGDEIIRPFYIMAANPGRWLLEDEASDLYPYKEFYPTVIPFSTFPEIEIGPGIGYTKQGDRVENKFRTKINLTIDRDGNSTVPTGSVEKWISVYALPSYEEADPRTDAKGNHLNFVKEIGCKFEVVAGTGHVPTYKFPVQPYRKDAIKVADVLISAATGAISHAFDPLNVNAGEISLRGREYYMANSENMVKAWCVTGFALAGDPPIVSESNVSKVVKNGVGSYQVFFKDVDSLVSGIGGVNLGSPVVVLVTPTDTQSFARAEPLNLAEGEVSVGVYFIDNALNPIDSAFSLAVLGKTFVKGFN